uniref:Uncharacterized protein n=1 Tax=Nelumbo nucifera TaxID=4432 RepID=A0A822YM29_NELNU|nr:TPA_asm: hypothetical protein HUJ06_011210 [Nelumbo nucifera]
MQNTTINQELTILGFLVELCKWDIFVWGLVWFEFER